MKIQICQIGEIPKLGKQIVAHISAIKIRAVSNLWRYPSTKTIFHFLSQEGRAWKLVLFHWEQQHQQLCHALPWILAMTQIRNCRKASKPWASCSSQSRKGSNRWLQHKEGLKWWGSEAYILIWLLFILMNFMRGWVCWANSVPKSQWSKRFWSFESCPISRVKCPRIRWCPGRDRRVSPLQRNQVPQVQKDKGSRYCDIYEQKYNCTAPGLLEAFWSNLQNFHL